MQSKIFGTHYDFDYLGSSQSRRIAAKIADLTEKAIHEEIVREARAAGVTDLYLMDRDFLLSAIREKQERMNPQPLTLDELRQMNGQPVWIAEENAWGIVGVDSCGFLKNRPFVKFRYDTIWCDYDIERRNLHCYRHKPEEVQG